MTIHDFHALLHAEEAKLTIELPFGSTHHIRMQPSTTPCETKAAREDAHHLPAIATCIANGIKKTPGWLAQERSKLQNSVSPGAGTRTFT